MWYPDKEIPVVKGDRKNVSISENITGRRDSSSKMLSGVHILLIAFHPIARVFLSIFFNLGKKFEQLSS
jgi:hypothetical protein